MVQNIHKIGDLIAGSAKSFSVEERIFNISALIGIIVSFLSITINIQLKMPIQLNILIGVGALSLIFIYIKSRLYKKSHLWFFIIIAIIILSVSWLFNEGPQGSINYIYILAFVVFLSITNRRHHLMVTMLLFINIALLYYIYYKFPHWVHPYPDKNIKESDLLFTYTYVIVFSALIFSSLRRSYENEKNKVQVQKEKIELQHKHITDSIFYAEEIQRALIQDIKELGDLFSEYFIVWYPKDIVSGDFYYFKSMPDNPHKVVVVVADCTGHGVPGALLTMLGISFLNEIILQGENLASHEILTQLRTKFIESLNYDKGSDEHSDGMDMAVCIIDKENEILDFSGANRPVFIIRNQELIEYKSDKFPVGMQLHKNKPFTNKIIKLEQGDLLYMFTDGYADQFGELIVRKLYVSNFKKLLLETSGLSLSEQGKVLNISFLEWKGVIEQIDDILVLGFKPL